MKKNPNQLEFDLCHYELFCYQLLKIFIATNYYYFFKTGGEEFLISKHVESFSIPSINYFIYNAESKTPRIISLESALINRCILSKTKLLDRTVQANDTCEEPPEACTICFVLQISLLW